MQHQAVNWSANVPILMIFNLSFACGCFPPSGSGDRFVAVNCTSEKFQHWSWHGVLDSCCGITASSMFLYLKKVERFTCHQLNSKTIKLPDTLKHWVYITQEMKYRSNIEEMALKFQVWCGSSWHNLVYTIGLTIPSCSCAIQAEVCSGSGDSMCWPQQKIINLDRTARQQMCNRLTDTVKEDYEPSSVHDFFFLCTHLCCWWEKKRQHNKTCLINYFRYYIL